MRTDATMYFAKRRSRGFSIIEVLITLTIMLVILWGGLLAYRAYSEKRKKATLAYNLSAIRQALSDYAKDNGRYPETLDRLVSAGTGTFRYISKIPIDPMTGLADWELKKGSSTSPTYLSGMIAYYPFREGVGNLTKDYTGKNPRATLYGTPSWTEGYSDECILFDGIDDYLYLDDTSTNSNNTYDDVIKERTISVFYNASALNGLPKIIYEEGGAINGMNIYIRNGVLYAGAWSESYGWNGDWLSIATTANAWHHAVLVFDLENSIMSMYYDGGFVASVAITVGIAEHTGDDAVGAEIDDTKIITGDINGGPGDYFIGMIDELRVYDRALSQSEVSGLFNKAPRYSWIEINEDKATTGEIMDIRSNNEVYKEW